MPQPITTTNQEGSSLDFFNLNKLLSMTKYPVYRACDRRHNRQVALKLFPIKNNVSINFKREINFLSKLDHQNIIRLYEGAHETPSTVSGLQEEQVSYLALEFAAYGDLLEIISTAGPLSEHLARSLFLQLIDALKYMHKMNVAHLDLKPENILIDENFCLKVTDFDLAQSADEAILEGRGTPGSRAPEIKEGTSKNFIKADVYSAGIILFVMMSGISPYQEIESGTQTDFDPFYKLMRKMNQKFWEVHAKHKNNENYYSKEFIDLVNSMLAEDSKERPSFDEIMDHPWMKQEVLIGEDYQKEMQKYLSSVKKLD